MNYQNKPTTLQQLITTNSSSRISTKRQLFAELKYMGNIYSDESCRTRLNTFQEAIFYSTQIDFSNPYFLSLAEDKLSLPEEVMFIHYRMGKFLFEHKFMEKILKYNYQTKSYDYEDYNFTYNIPITFIPVFIAYVLASTFHKKITPSVECFFDNMQFYLNNEKYYKSTEHRFPHNIQSFSTQWIDQYLCREYYAKLENLCRTYTRTKEQKEQMISSVDLLTEIVTTCPENSPHAICAANTLLNDFEQSILNRDEKNGNDKEDLFSYANSFPTKPEEDIASKEIEKYNDETEKHIKIIQTLLNKYQQKDSPYPLAVSNYEKFKNEYEKCIISSINNLQDETTDRISQCFSQLKVPSEDTQYIDESKRNKRIHILQQIFSKYYRQQKQDYLDLLKKIEISSNPSIYPKRSAKCINISANEFYDNIRKNVKNLNAKIEKHYTPLPFCIQCQYPGFLHRKGFKYPYSAELLFHIFTVLSNTLGYEPSDSLKENSVRLINELKKQDILNAFFHPDDFKK